MHYLPVYKMLPRTLLILCIYNNPRKEISSIRSTRQNVSEVKFSGFNSVSLLSTFVSSDGKFTSLCLGTLVRVAGTIMPTS